MRVTRGVFTPLVEMTTEPVKVVVLLSATVAGLRVIAMVQEPPGGTAAEQLLVPTVQILREFTSALILTPVTVNEPEELAAFEMMRFWVSGVR